MYMLPVALVHIYQNITLVALFFPKLASISHTLTHRGVYSYIHSDIVIKYSIFSMNHFLSYWIVSSFLPSYLITLGPLKFSWKARTLNSGVGWELWLSPACGYTNKLWTATSRKLGFPFLFIHDYLSHSTFPRFLSLDLAWGIPPPTMSSKGSFICKKLPFLCKKK